MRNARELIGVTLTLVLMACTAPRQTQLPRSEAETPRPVAPKRITAAISSGELEAALGAWRWRSSWGKLGSLREPLSRARSGTGEFTTGPRHAA